MKNSLCDGNGPLYGGILIYCESHKRVQYFLWFLLKYVCFPVCYGYLHNKRVSSSSKLLRGEMEECNANT